MLTFLLKNKQLLALQTTTTMIKQTHNCYIKYAFLAQNLPVKNQLSTKQDLL